MTRVFQEAAETSGKAHCRADVKQAGEHDPLNEGFGNNMVVDINDDRYGWPTPPARRTEGWDDWFEEACRKANARKSTPIYNREYKKALKEAGPDAMHDAATTNFYETLTLSLAVLADRCNNTAKVIELLLEKGIDESDQSPDPEKMDKRVREMFERLGDLRAELKGFRPW